MQHLAASIFHYQSHGVNGVKMHSLKTKQISCKIIKAIGWKIIFMKKSIDDIDFEKSGGLIPIIVQDAFYQRGT